jgi:hypothetical protein
MKALVVVLYVKPAHTLQVRGVHHALHVPLAHMRHLPV